jgi:hypothetical protein
MKTKDLLYTVERFLAKQAAVHVALQEFKATKQYQELEDALTAAIRAQVAEIAHRIGSLNDEKYLSPDMEPLSDSQLIQLRLYIYRHMPTVASEVNVDLVYRTLLAAFVLEVKQLYHLFGVVVKGDVTFQLENQEYLGQLHNQAAYLLNRSSIDDTTLDRMVSLISQGKQDMLTNPEIADLLTSDFEAISSYRAGMIARTEVAAAMGRADLAAMRENGVATKAWVVAGEGCSRICRPNSFDGYISVDAYFNSGDTAPPGHPNCECYLDPGVIDLSAPGLVLWGGQ